MIRVYNLLILICICSTLSCEKKYSHSKELIEFSFPNQKYKQYKTLEGYHFDFYEHVDLKELIPWIKISEGATIMPLSGIKTDFSEPVLYTITAEDGSCTTFEVMVSKNLSSECQLLNFSLQTPIQVVEMEGDIIYVYVPYDVDITNLSANIEVSLNAKVLPLCDAVMDYSTPVKYTVISSDGGSSKDYFIQVKKSPWKQLLRNGAAPFLKVDGHRLLSFNGYMWLMGGWLGKNHNFPPGDYFTSQVWRTKDGLKWEDMGNAPWKERHGFGCVAYKGKMWVIGGDNNHDVWNSVDGINWNLVSDNLPFGTRYFPYVTVFQDKIYVIGGKSGIWNQYNVYNDVWSTTDGINWECETQNAQFVARSLISGAIVMNSEMYIIGGGVVGPVDRSMEYNDIWKSNNGVCFQLVCKEPPFEPLYWHSIGTYKDKMYVCAGMHRGDKHINELWYSSNGIDWLQQKYNFWAPRHATSMIEFNNKLYMIGGTIDPVSEQDTQNDVWVMESDL